MERTRVLVFLAVLLTGFVGLPAGAAPVPENACALLSPEEIRAGTGLTPRYVMPATTCIGVADPSITVSLSAYAPDPERTAREERELAAFRQAGAGVVVQRDGAMTCWQVLQDIRAAELFQTVCHTTGNGVTVRLSFAATRRASTVPIDRVKPLVTMMARRAGVL